MSDSLLDQLNAQAARLYQQGRFAEATKAALLALQQAERAGGLDHPAVATSLGNLGALHLAQGHYAEAESPLVRALAMTERVLGPNHRDTATCLNNLAGLYQAQGSYAKAEPLYLRALGIGERALGTNHPQTAKSLDSLATLYYALGRYHEAEPLLERALAILEYALGGDHRDTVKTQNHLAATRRAQGRFAKADPLYRRALTIGERTPDADHPETALSLSSQAKQVEAQGRYDDAEVLLERALAIYERTLGPDHPDTATSLNNLAMLYATQGRYAEAERQYSRALAIRECGLGLAHPNTAATVNNLASLFKSQGRYAEAELLYERTLAICERVLGPDHPDLGRVCNNFAQLYLAWGHYDQAEQLFLRAQAISERTLGPDHPDTATSLSNLGVAYYVQGRTNDAEPFLERALLIRERVLFPDHPDTAASFSNLGALYQSQGRFVEAEPLLVRALASCGRMMGADHPKTAIGANNVAALYQAQGRYAEAEPLLQRALAVFEKVPTAQHPDTAASLSNLAVLYGAQDRFAEALASMQRALEINDRVIARNLAGGSETARAAFLAKFAASQDAFLSLLVRSFPDDRAVAADALDRILRRKAIGAELLAAQRDAVLGGRYPALAPRLKELQGLRAQIAAKTLAGPGAEGIEQHRTWLADWNEQRDAIEAELARQIPEMNLELRLRGVDRAAVATALPDGSALVEYVRFTEFDFQAVPARGEKPWKSTRYLAFVLPAGRPDDVTLLDLGEAAFIDKRIAALREAVTGETERKHAARAPPPASVPLPRSLWRLFGMRQPTAAASAPVVASDRSIEDALLAASIERIRHCGEAVRAAVFDPLRPALGDAAQLFISPDGDLYRLPFEILPAADGQYLIDACRISYLGAGRDLLRFSARQLTEPGPPLVLADPDFDLCAPPAQAAPSQPAQRGRRSRELDQAGLRFDPLPDARAEGEQVAGVLGTRPWLAERCLESELKACRSPRILHVATHGFFLADQEVSPERRSWSGFGDGDRLRGPGMENPLLRSGLALAGANTFLRGGQLPPQAEDGLLTAEDVSGMDLLDTELVVLSACETGLGEVKVGEGVFGLRRAFVLAGAQTLVMSLWKVPDEATRELMRDFYAGLLVGQPRAEALRAAQLALKARDSDPMVWGAFILQGETGALAVSG